MLCRARHGGLIVEFVIRVRYFAVENGSFATGSRGCSNGQLLGDAEIGVLGSRATSSLRFGEGPID